MTTGSARMATAVASINSGIRTLKDKRDKISDDTMKELFLGLMLVSEGLRIALDVLPQRIERLHQKVDRIEKKIGSV